MVDSLEQLKYDLAKLAQMYEQMDEAHYLHSLIKRCEDSVDLLEIKDKEAFDPKDAIIVGLGRELYRLNKLNQLHTETLARLVDLLSIFIEHMILVLAGKSEEFN